MQQQASSWSWSMRVVLAKRNRALSHVFLRRRKDSLRHTQQHLLSCHSQAALHVSEAWHTGSCGAPARRRHDPGCSVNHQASRSLAHQPASVVRCSAVFQIRLAHLHTRRARAQVARGPAAMGLSGRCHCPCALGWSLCWSDNCPHGPG